MSVGGLLQTQTETGPCFSAAVVAVAVAAAVADAATTVLPCNQHTSYLSQ